ncbi:tryptophan synthase subunit alpha, partial [Kineococcus glutinatus]|uniref:tryptophan synthase subunit alpha n=1 Tax=Kineococcus glutinatus TaxID=1070872 RepID=UPI0031E76A11
MVNAVPGTEQVAPAGAGTRRTAAAAVDAARAQGRAALVAYLPVGYPDVAGSVEAARALVDSGADVVELGLPYSDPTMDGPVIQRAVDAALAARTRPADVLRAVEQVAATGAAVLVMTYWPPVDRYGVARFAADLASAGAAGLITPDLIPDEADAWIAASDAHDLERVFLVAPSSTPARLRSTAAACRGFVYAASTMGVTGARASVGAGARGLVERTRAAGAERVCVGLGVSTGEQAAEVAGYADGVIVGSAFVRRLLEAPDHAAGVRAAAALAAELAEGVRRGGPA